MSLVFKLRRSVTPNIRRFFSNQSNPFTNTAQQAAEEVSPATRRKNAGVAVVLGGFVLTIYYYTMHKMKQVSLFANLSNQEGIAFVST